MVLASSSEQALANLVLSLLEVDRGDAHDKVSEYAESRNTVSKPCAKHKDFASQLGRKL